MHQISDVRLDRDGRSAVMVTATLRSPELGLALQGAGLTFVLSVWGTVTVILCWLAWEGAFGGTAHAFVRLCIASSIVLWLVFNGNRLWQQHNRTTHSELRVRCDPQHVIVDGPDGGFTVFRDGDEVRFSSRPHRAGVQEERDERWVGHPIGYAYRDAWEVWLETGLDVELVVSVSSEQDARTIVRHLSEANLIATRGADISDFDTDRWEPA